MKTKTSIILIILSSFYIISCKYKIQPLKDIDINRKSKLYFYNIPPTKNQEKQYKNEFKQKHKNFFIDDQSVLNQIKDEWKLVKSKNHIPLKSFYRVNLLEGNKILWGAIINLNGNEIFTSTYHLKFEIETLEKYSDSFKHLEAYTVICNNILNARLLYEELNNKGYFVGIYINEDEKNPLYLYDGSTSLMLSYKKSVHFKELEKQIKKDFEKIENTKISRFQASTEKDSVEIELYSKTDISNLIPEKYTIVKNFTLLKDLNFSVFGISVKELEQIITKLNLKNNITITKNQ